MDLEHEIQVKGSCVLIICRGNFSNAAAKAVFEEALATAAKHDLGKILIDAREVRGKFSMEERYYLGDFLARQKLKTKDGVSLRFGFVGNDLTVDPRRFAETVARNRGVMVKVGTDWNEICDWLWVEFCE